MNRFYFIDFSENPWSFLINCFNLCGWPPDNFVMQQTWSSQLLLWHRAQQSPENCTALHFWSMPGCFASLPFAPLFVDAGLSAAATKATKASSRMFAMETWPGCHLIAVNLHGRLLYHFSIFFRLAGGSGTVYHMLKSLLITFSWLFGPLSYIPV